MIGLIAVMACVAGFEARADVRCTDSSATIQADEYSTPDVILFTDFSVMVWFRPEEFVSERRSIFQLPGGFTLGIEGDQTIFFNIDQSQVSYEVELTHRMNLNEWTLVGASFKRSNGQLALMARSEGSVASVNTIIPPDYQYGGLGPVLGGLTIGAHPDGLPGAVGTWGVVAIRENTLSQADIDLCFESKYGTAPYDLVTAGIGGQMDGPEGCLWMTNHAMTTDPIDGANHGIGQYDKIAMIGLPVGRHNLHIYARDLSSAEPLTTVWPADHVEGFTYVSHREPPLNTFFETLPFSANLGGWSHSKVPALKTRQLFRGPQQLLRVMVSANSRAVKNDDGTGEANGNYAHGFIDNRRNLTAGVFFRPAVVDYDASRRYPWFGLDCQDEGPYAGEPGTVVTVERANIPQGDFSRFGTGAGSGSIGPGAGVFMFPETDYSMRCKPESGSLLGITDRLALEAHVLKFPGASRIWYRADKAPSQGAEGQPVAPAESINLDTTRETYTMQSGDLHFNRAILYFPDAPDLDPRIGDAVFIAEGAGAGSISVITNVTKNGNLRQVFLDRQLWGAPEPGTVFHFGPWEWTTISIENPGLQHGAPNQWRGLRLSTAGGYGAHVMSYSAWNADADEGLLWGVAGWGGNGYRPQLEQAFEGAVQQWMALTRTDVWIQVPAQQNSQPESMGDFADAIEAALPQAEIVWAGEMAHLGGGLRIWHTYIRDHATDRGIVGISAIEDPRIGTQTEQLADGHRSDGAHLTRRGARKLAEVWLDLISQAAEHPADFNGDGIINSGDFVAFLNSYVRGDEDADLNRDGAINTIDFIYFFNAYNLPD